MLKTGNRCLQHSPGISTGKIKAPIFIFIPEPTLMCGRPSGGILPVSENGGILINLTSKQKKP